MNRVFSCLRRVVVLLGISAVLAGAASAQSFPSKSIKLITPYAPGGSTDVVSRIVSPKLSKILGVPVVVENMPGANGNIALAYLAKAPADGHTLMISSTSPIVINPHTYPNSPVDILRDFTPISLVANTESVIVVHPSVPASNLKELIELSKQRDVFFGISGLGGQPEMLIKKMNLETGSKFKAVPFSGGGGAINAILGGHVQAILNDIASSMPPMLQAGKLRGVAVLENKPKSEFLPTTSTVAAQGFPGIVSHSWLFLLGPAQIPAETAEKIRKALEQAVLDPEIVALFRSNALLPAPSRSVAEARGFIEQQNEFFKKMQKETGVKVSQ